MLPEIERGHVPTVAYRPPDSRLRAFRQTSRRASGQGQGMADGVVADLARWMTFLQPIPTSYSINFLYLNLLGASSPRRFFLFSSYSE